MGRKALLVIDMLRDFLDPEGALYCGDQAREIVPKVLELLEEHRRRGSLIVFVADHHEPGDREFELFPPHCVEGTPGAQLLPQFQAGPGEHLVRKRRYSAFFGTTLDQYLQEQKVDHLVLCGINTHACIRTAAIDAYQRDYRVLLPRECIGSYDDEHARVTMRYLDGKIGRVIGVEDVVEMVRAT